MRGALPPILVLLALLPAAQGHGLVNAGELETLIVQDEASDVVTGLDLGYDLVQLYVGEAHVPGLGDGFYVHTILYGGVGDRPVLDGEMAVRFDFEFNEGTFTRTLSTMDGKTFTSDFDQLIVVPGDGEVEVQRAFVLYPEGIGPSIQAVQSGSTLQSLRATSLVNGEPRDVAPGGTFLPGAPIEVPNFEGSNVDTYHLQGTGGYVEKIDLDAERHEDGLVFVVTAHSALKNGSQHILLSAPEQGGWSVQVEGNGGDTPPGGNQTFRLRFTPGEGDYTFDVLTDIGGRETLLARHSPTGYWVESPDGAVSVPSDPLRDLPSPSGWAIVVLVLATALLARKAQR